MREDLKEGSIVMCLDEKSSRGTWPMGRVTRVIKSGDGHVRSAMIKTQNGEYHRPISKLCLLLEDDINIHDELT